MRLAWTLFFSVCATATGCGGDDDDDSGGIPFEDVPAELADVFCSQVEPCMGQLADMFSDSADCAEETTAQITDGDWVRIEAAIEAGTVIYNEDRAQACLDAFAALGCDVFVSRPPEECEEAVEGTVAIDGACDQDAECVGTAFCLIEAECPGACTARQSEGGDCGDDDECEDGLTCQRGACTALAEAGEDCEGEDAPECGVGLMCVGQDEQQGTSGTCQAPEDTFTAAEGEECNLPAGPFCVEGLSCVIDRMEAMQPVFVCVGASASGGDCKAGFPDPCPDDEVCDANPFEGGQFDGTCVPLAANGEPCSAVLFGTGCVSGLVCDEDRNCTTVNRIGESCETDAGCYSGNCESNICAAPPECEAD
ncbi:MAG: hypothetical protein HYY06_28890 [Deltaproteobacteria bacterium]|nr:hypothetical protein [Deltaproteobacteria bacterium]